MIEIQINSMYNIITLDTISLIINLLKSIKLINPIVLMKKVLKSKDLKDESSGATLPNFNYEKAEIEAEACEDVPYAHAKADAPREKRRISTKSSPDSRQRSHERAPNPN